MKQMTTNGFSSCYLPLNGIVFMATSPPLRNIVLHFLLIVLAVSLTTTVAAFFFLWDFHMHLLSKYFQYVISARIVTTLLLFAEGAIPAALVFSQKFEGVQQQLFDETLKLKGVQPAQISETETRQLKEQACHPPAPPHTVKEPHWLRLTKPVNFLYSVLFLPKLGETFAISRVREVANRTVGSFLPFLIPFLAFRDSTFLAADLMKRYWHMKGITDDQVLEALQGKYLWEYRGFGAVAAALNYVPILNWALGLTNSVGAALLAAKLEERGAKLS